MCSCHKLNKLTGKIERVKGVFSLRTANVGDKFKFEFEAFYRIVVIADFKNAEVFAPPENNYTGFEEKGEHVYHMSFKAEFDGFIL